VVRLGVDVIPHTCGLRILAEHRIVARGPGRGHRAQRLPPYTGREQPLADEPFCLVGGLAELFPLTSDPKTSDIDSLRVPGWPGYMRPASLPRDAVAQLMADHVEGDAPWVGQRSAESGGSIRHRARSADAGLSPARAFRAPATARLLLSH
jgi:hypothetical protein